MSLTSLHMSFAIFFIMLSHYHTLILPSSISVDPKICPNFIFTLILSLILNPNYMCFFLPTHPLILSFYYFVNYFIFIFICYYIILYYLSYLFIYYYFLFSFSSSIPHLPSHPLSLFLTHTPPT